MKIEQLNKKSIFELQIHNDQVYLGLYSILVYDRENKELLQQDHPFRQENNIVIDLLKTTEVMNMRTNYNTASKHIFTRGELSIKDVCDMINDVEKFITFIDFITTAGVVKEYATMTPFIKEYKVENIIISEPIKEYGYKITFIWHDMKEIKDISRRFLDYGMRIINMGNMNAAIDLGKINNQEMQIHFYEVK